MAKGFIKNSDGNVAMMFGGAAMMIMMGVGFAYDFNAMTKQQQVYQNLADAAALAAAASGEDNPVKLKALANDVVDGQNFSGAELTTDLKVIGGHTIRVNVSAEYEYAMMGLFGYKTSTISAMAEAPPRGDGKINLALVLDVTGSMDGAKIDALRTAANDLVNDLTDSDNDGTGDDGTTMISVVPFARHMQIPMTTAGESWLEIFLDEDCDEVDWDASENCVEEEYEDDDDGVIETRTTTVCETYVYQCVTDPWEGCVGSRAYPWNTRAHFGGAPIPGMAKDMWCDQEVLPLTTSISTVTGKISGLWTADETYIPGGLVWGWRTLTPQAPFTEANTSDKAERKNAMLLMTDGMNTRSTWDTDPRYHWGHDTDDANTITAELCNGIKDDDIVVYTVAFEVSDPDTQTLLRNCATDADKYFDADSITELKDAFEDVGLDLAQVRLSK